MVGAVAESDVTWGGSRVVVAVVAAVAVAEAAAPLGLGGGALGRRQRRSAAEVEAVVAIRAEPHMTGVGPDGLEVSDRRGRPLRRAAARGGSQARATSRNNNGSIG